MKTIDIRNLLVPIDFRSNSMNALNTATAIAKRHHAKIHLLFVDDCDYELFKEDNYPKPRSLPDYMKALAQLAKTVIHEDEVACSYSSENGPVTHSILRTAISLNSDLIVMGKNGANGPSIEYAGTHTCQVAEKSRIPLLVVPEGVVKYYFENILFPMRPLLSVLEKYDAIRPFILKNNPAITVLTLRNPNYHNEMNIITRLSTLIKKKLESDNVPYVMDNYFKDNHFAEHVVYMLTRNTSTFDLAVITSEFDKHNDDFHMSFYAKKIIHQCSIPILIIHPENPKLDKYELLFKFNNEESMN